MIPKEAVEAAARAAAKDEDASNWHDESEYYRNGWRNRMQVGLEAAAPHMSEDDAEDDAQFTPDYKLPEPIVLPDLSDDKVWAEYVKRAEDCERETRRMRRRYWLHQLFPWM